MCLDGPGKSSAVVQSISCSMGTGALQLSKCSPLVLVIEAVFSSGEPYAKINISGQFDTPLLAGKARVSL